MARPKSLKSFLSLLVTPEAAFFYFLSLLLLPNILLSVTENLRPIAFAANILVPLGVYAFLMSLSRNLGRSTWIFLPIVLLAISQIVLLSLYGRSVIAVDMFLNLTTTNPGESGELFGSIFPIVGLVVLLYLPSMIAGIWMWAKKISLPEMFTRYTRRLSMAVAAYGIVCVVIAGFTDKTYKIRNDLYPVNAAYNMGLAARHSYKIYGREENPCDFTFEATDNHPDSVREVYVLVIGETSRADHWQVNGYPRETNPLLSKRRNLYSFRKVMSESNTTHKSVPLLLSHLNATTYGDSIFYVKSLLTAFKEAGYSTAFLSNQTPNGSFIQFFGEEADTTVYVSLKGSQSDLALLPVLDEVLAKDYPRQLIVLHGYGSHFNYRDRYSRDEAYFQPDEFSELGERSRDRLVNAYDNSIRVTDRLLDGVIERLEKKGAERSAMLFTADHGEDLYDDNRGLLLHSSPCPTFYQLHVPFMVWLSEGSKNELPEIAEALERNLNMDVISSRSFFDTALGLAGITTPRTPLKYSVVNPAYKPAERLYLNDHNHAVSLRRSGFIAIDFKHVKEMERGKK